MTAAATNRADAFTAAQIAAALGITARAVALRLKGIAPSGTTLVRGQSANTWSFVSLPSSLSLELTRLAKERGFPDVMQLIDAPVAPWTPGVLWHSLPERVREHALKLCDALAPVLDVQHTKSGPELLALARVSYRQHFGHEVADSKLRYLMDRATKRDNNLRQFHRPDLYLDDSALRMPGGSAAAPAPHDGHGLAEAVQLALKPVDKQHPTALDRAHLFHAAFEQFEKLGSKAAFIRAAVAYLYRTVPGLYRPRVTEEGSAKESKADKPFAAIRRLFNLNYRIWIERGRTVDCLIKNGRATNGRKAYHCEKCYPGIKRRAARLYNPAVKKGNVELAVKLQREDGMLCSECMRRLNPSRLSAATRRALTPNAYQVTQAKRGDFRKIMPTKRCDRSGDRAGERFVIDDATTNEPGWDIVNGEVISGKVQMLAAEDEYCGQPFPFELYFGAPNSRSIKREFRKVLTTVGLPHIAFITERGVFANKMLYGDRRRGEEIPMREFKEGMSRFVALFDMDNEELARYRTSELGLRDPAFGLNLQPVYSPSAKTIERSFYEFQKSASELPGFGGFNQRKEQPKHLTDFDRRVALGKEHPGNEYMHLSEMRKKYEEIWQRIANRKKRGHLRGRSPLEVWSEDVDRFPLRKLPAEMEHLLAVHRLPDRKIKDDGITVQLSEDDEALYANAHTGRYLGQRVDVLIDYDHPEFIHIENKQIGKPLKVERIFIKRWGATPEELARVNDARRAHRDGALAEFGNLKNLVTSAIAMDTAYTPEDMDRGRRIGEATAQAKAEKAERAEVNARTRETLLDAGLDPDEIKNPDRSVAAIQEYERLRADYLARNPSQEPTP